MTTKTFLALRLGAALTLHAIGEVPDMDRSELPIYAEQGLSPDDPIQRAGRREAYGCPTLGHVMADGAGCRGSMGGL